MRGDCLAVDRTTLVGDARAALKGLIRPFRDFVGLLHCILS